MPTSPVGWLTLGENDNLQECFEDWKNSVTLINNECQKYGNSKAKSVRSLTIEDLEDEKVSTLASQKLSYTDSYGIKYGETKTYTSGSSFAAEYNETTKENEILESLKSAPVTLKQTNYDSSNPGCKTLRTSRDTYGTLLGNTLSWLASSCVYFDSAYAYFGVYRGHGGSVSTVGLFVSGGYTNSDSYGVRPLVTLSSAVLEAGGVNGDFATWTIKN